MCVTDRRHSKYVLSIYCIGTRVTRRDHLCVLPTDDAASMHLLFTVLLTQVTCRDHVCVLLTDAQQVCIYYLLYIFYPGNIPGPFMCVTDRRHSKFLFTIYSLVTRVACRDHVFVLPTDDTESIYQLFTVLLPGRHVRNIYVWYRQTTQQVCINYLLYGLPGWHVGTIYNVCYRQTAQQVYIH